MIAGESRRRLHRRRLPDYQRDYGRGFYAFDNASFKYVDAFGDESDSSNETSSFAGGISGAYKWRMLSGGVTIKVVRET